MSTRKRRARFGPAWWDRGGHFGTRLPDGSVEVTGVDGVWPRPCLICVRHLAPRWVLKQTVIEVTE